ncbi:tetratricopeptide repeat protein [Spirochaetia bacterium 38H-sp]|uniref:Tetratricopeptide repeat protein n=1 Tax=Rarispira pelagica TaxID=3141764 RepID=A0ABU9UAL8_9SPIR
MKRVLFFLLFFLIVFYSFPQAYDSYALYRDALIHIQNGEYDSAEEILSQLIKNKSDKYYADALFWYAKITLSSGEIDKASSAIEIFLTQKGVNPSYLEEAKYLKGRILFLNEDYESCIKYYDNFLTEYPESSFYANSLFWTAESMFNLGLLKEARSVYDTIAKKYSGSYKAEAAAYRVKLIDYATREEELIDLLRWCQEEYLKVVEQMGQKEKSYKEALSVYQKRLAEAPSSEEYEALQKKVEELTAENEALKKQIQELKSGVSSSAIGQ